MSRSRYKFSGDQRPHFLTCTVVGWARILSKKEIANIILNSLIFLQNSNRIELFGYVIMNDHLHLIASSKNLSKEIANFKSYTARQIIKVLVDKNDRYSLFRFKALKEDRQFQVWQEGSHPQVIMNRIMMIQKLKYIHYNPVKKGYVDDPLDWRYSSARNYIDLKGEIEINVDW